MRFCSLFFFALLLFVQTAFGESPNLTSVAEKSGWQKTGRYEEVLQLCKNFERSFSKKVRCKTFGLTPEGRPMVALIVRENSQKSLPVVFFQGGIHAGEIDGKDAGFFILREILSGRILPNVLKKLTIVFVPVFNIDGHERFGKNNRPNQIGPEEMGWRTTSQNFNLNRDYAKADTPEMAAMLKFLREWDPIAYVDLHVTDGADFQHDISITVSPSEFGDKRVAKDATELQDEVLKYLSEQRHLPLNFYPEFKGGIPSGGAERRIAPPRFSDAYWGLRNRIGILVETHSWKNYAQRVKATQNAIVGILRSVEKDGTRFQKNAVSADKASASLANQTLVLSAETTEKSKTIEFKGFHYVEELSEISGQKEIRYDPSKPEIWKIPFFDELKPKLEVAIPARGYVVPPAYAAVIAQKLDLHGIQYQKISKLDPSAQVEVFRAESTEFGKSPYEGRMTLKVAGKWTTEKRPIPAGSLFVPSSQPLARLATFLFEPLSPDSFLSWGYFNAAFERKEYMENYVAHLVGKDMLARDPKIKEEFEKKLSEDADFKNSGKKRLDFFYRKHPSWDERYGMYPVYRLL